jgi:hypothetical protein
MSWQRTFTTHSYELNEPVSTFSGVPVREEDLALRLLTAGEEITVNYG